MISRQALERVVELHGHVCRASPSGIRAANVAWEETGLHSPHEEVAVIERRLARSRAARALWQPCLEQSVAGAARVAIPQVAQRL